ncbi:MAG: 2-amino-4-hydroxy-6-hydroxymethyldihydropteridine diphosphokinase [Anaerolineaceae bacterium]
MPAIHKVYLSLGTNLGNRVDNLRQACEALSGAFGSLQTSSIYETDPWGYSDQPAFLNMVAAAETELIPEDLLIYIKELEKELGRQPSFRYGPRKIDIDILFYDDLVLVNERLEIPHPRLAERAFVLVPLAEMSPDLVHPSVHLTVRELLGAVDMKSVKFYQSFSIIPHHPDGKAKGTTMNSEVFKAELEAIGPGDSITCVRIPFSVKHVFSRNGSVAVAGTLNGVPFESTLEMEGNGTHTMLVDDNTLQAAKVKAGETVDFVLYVRD